MKKLLLVKLFFISLIYNGLSQERQTLSLAEAYQLLENNYPNLKNENLLDEVFQLDLKNLDITTKPSIQLKGEGRIQTDAPSVGGEGLPISVDLPLYNFKTYAEANYLIYDGGINDALKAQKENRLLAEKQTFQVEKYQLRARINVLFIGILLNREQVKLLDITLADLAARREIIAAGVEYGTILESEKSKLQVRELEIGAEKSNLLMIEKGLIATLELLTAIDLAPNLELTLPDLPNNQLIPEIQRPEQELFKLQKQALLANESLITAQRKPKIAAFAQAGLGYPNQLNFFEQKFAPYGIAGISFQWNITDWKKESTDRQLLSVQAQQFDNQLATFEFNINSAKGKYLAEVERLNDQIASDEKIADLQAEILVQLAAQLENGVITTTDYLAQANAELLARQKQALHQIQLINIQLNFLNERGGL